MILKALDESYKNHIGFGIMRASGEEQRLLTPSLVSATVLSSGPERVKGRAGGHGGLVVCLLFAGEVW